MRLFLKWKHLRQDKLRNALWCYKESYFSKTVAFTHSEFRDWSLNCTRFQKQLWHYIKHLKLSLEMTQVLKKKGECEKTQWVYVCFLCACLFLYQCDFSKYDKIQGSLIGAWWHKLLSGICPQHHLHGVNYAALYHSPGKCSIPIGLIGVSFFFI